MPYVKCPDGKHKIIFLGRRLEIINGSDPTEEAVYQCEICGELAELKILNQHGDTEGY